MESEKIAGLFSLDVEKDGDIVEEEAVNENDIALILHTSGTTSKPKIVPLIGNN